MCISFTYRVRILAAEQMKHNLSSSITIHFNAESSNGQRFSQILLELLDSADQKVQLSSAECLFEIFSAESILLTEMENLYLVSQETANSSEYKEMVSLGTCQDEKKMLWNIDKKNASERNELVEVLQRVSDYCVMKDNKLLPNPVHQNIAYSCGTLSIKCGVQQASNIHVPYCYLLYNFDILILIET